ncbi:MAG: hypothetical protein HKN47_17565 [Pirellulaceae bacterium]|nr:hypothetical protein [Pirellulaceae bacterium]
METSTDQRATDPCPRFHETETLESLRDEWKKFAYEMQCRLELLTELVTRQHSNPVCTGEDPNAIEDAQVEPQTPLVDPSQVTHRYASESDASGAETADVKALSDVSEAPEPTEASDALERLAALRLRFEKQMARGKQS